jgi:hypothetical protein
MNPCHQLPKFFTQPESFTSGKTGLPLTSGTASSSVVVDSAENVIIA